MPTPDRDATLYKVLATGRMPRHGGRGQWPEPGVWRSVEGPLVPCENGLHLCRGERQLLDWLGPAIWLAEVEGETLDLEDKVVCRRARLVERVTTWTDTTARLFAADCAEHVLPVFEREHPGDDRPRRAIQAVRQFARRELAATPLTAAAAWAAARDAAEAAAGDAAWAAAGDAASAAAWAAAGAAAEAAAEAAAGNAERDWQAARLRAYLAGEIGGDA